MQVAGAPATTGTGTREGVPVMSVDGIDRRANQVAPMTVFTRSNVGRFDGYGSLASAISAARNLSRGTDRSAVVVDRRADGIYEVREAVWRYLWGRNQPPTDRAPYRHFHFEDGSFSQYTAWATGSRVEVTARDWYRSHDGATRWLVDGARVLEVTAQGGSGR